MHHPQMSQMNADEWHEEVLNGFLCVSVVKVGGC